MRMARGIQAQWSRVLILLPSLPLPNDTAKPECCLEILDLQRSMERLKVDPRDSLN